MPSTGMILRWTAAAFAVATLAACQPAGPGGAMPTSTQSLPTAEKNGARIYFTAASERGTAITYTGGPDIGGVMMAGGGLSVSDPSLRTAASMCLLRGG